MKLYHGKPQARHGDRNMGENSSPILPEGYCLTDLRSMRPNTNNAIGYHSNILILTQLWLA